MADPHVVGVPRAKRVELAGENKLTSIKLQRLGTALEALTRRFACSTGRVPEAIEPKVWRPKANWARHGEMTRVRFDILRQAPASICNREIPGVHDGAPHGHG